MNTPALEIRNLSLAYDFVFREEINLRLDSGEAVAILGPSGCGKSTLLKTILGAVTCQAGDIEIDGQSVRHLPIDKRGVGIVFQTPMLFPHLSVGRNVSYGLERQGVSRDLARARVQELLAWVDMNGYANRAVDTLSGGQAQRVALARAMAIRPKVLLLDEPFSALDDDLRQRLASETAEKLRAAGVAVVYVTHSREEANAVADRVIEFNSLGRPVTL